MDGIDQIDREVTDSETLFFWVNCAHPAYFSGGFGKHARLNGTVANASSCAHAELEKEDELDEGETIELGRQIAEIARQIPLVQVFGGCCRTDMRQLKSLVIELAWVTCFKLQASAEIKEGTVFSFHKSS